MRKETSLPMVIAIVGLLCFGIVNFAIAQDRPERGTPPKEAIAACQNKDTGTTCSMKTPRGDTIEGTCKYTPDEKYFVCMPEGGPQMPPKR
jgi:hypothetical protein